MLHRVELVTGLVTVYEGNTGKIFDVDFLSLRGNKKVL